MKREREEQDTLRVLPGVPASAEGELRTMWGEAGLGCDAAVALCTRWCEAARVGPQSST